ncbi:MAG: hypothetical protein IPO67_12100 [Deltaproteobacteria bacterium]|nr:hypothetical protein [Deltaproteobacteria bacterium]MBK9645873.1 hypothetical protein [Deltaproteobacteria bacterium]
MRPSSPRCILPVLCVVMAACEPPPYTPTETPASSTPTIEIIFPDPALGPYCNEFMMVVDIDNHILNPGFYEEELEPVEGEGHWHLVYPAGNVDALGMPYAWVTGELVPGRYPFTAQLVENNHTPLLGAQVDVVELDIDGDDPDCIGGAGTNPGYDDTGDSGA